MKKNVVIAILALMVLGMGIYIWYDKSSKKEVVPTNQNDKNEVVEKTSVDKLLNDYYGYDNMEYNRIDYVAIYHTQKYTVNVGEWTNYGNLITVKDTSGKTVYQTYARSNFFIGEDEISFEPFVDNNEVLHYVTDECGKQGVVYHKTVDLTGNTFSPKNYQDLSEYDLGPHGIPTECNVE